ncbi:uncharacterized protein F5147DRAFT_771276 [Suillus discolor]|uniref:Uncharacterized protein n=1 Tax=Suillus discolor TaxID=1912936 RepID=A0A9P7FBZ1_9AGAM|nr:uncharacterized protein F5147DRAFT_771276 [Suillus discolor]KAG2112212.1 hypothetical protein F5147DRAFT_771276 [Suillus discolor]
MSLTGSFTKPPQMYSGLSMNKSKSKAWLPPPSNLNSLITTSPPCAHVRKSAKSCNTFLPDQVPDQQVLEDLEAVVKTRLDLKDNQDGLSLGRCAVILEALQNPQPNTFPKDDSLASQVLRASPTMDYENFIPCHIKKSLRFGPVTIQSHVWIDVCEVRYTMYKCGADGHFNFNSKNAETFTEGTIYPEIKMDDIEHILSEAVESLKDYIVSLMEGMGLEEPAIWSVRESRPVWDPMWEAALNQISTTVYLTAYCRYMDWQHHKYEKRKLSVAQASTGTSLSSNLTTGLLSNPTTSSLTDQPHMPSSRLSIDAEPEHSAKKAKVDDRKVPKSKLRKSKKAKERVNDL